MALINCPDCKSSISDQAKACPNCGRSMVYWTFGRIVLALIALPAIFFGVLYFIYYMSK